MTVKKEPPPYDIAPPIPDLVKPPSASGVHQDFKVEGDWSIFVPRGLSQ